MDGWTMAAAWATTAAVAAATLSLLVLLWRKPKHAADMLFALVSGSLAISLMRPWLVDAPTWMQWAMAIVGSVTCNGFWLVSRALFRGKDGVGRAQLALAGGVAGLIVAYRGAVLAAGDAPSSWVSGLGALVTLATSALLVASYVEALRGWSPCLPLAERRLRLAFLLVFGATVLSTTLVGALADTGLAPGNAKRLAIGLGALAMVLLTHAALAHRHRSPLQTAIPPAARAPAATAPRPEDARLAKALKHQLQVLQVYREPELKVADLAQRMGTAEHKLSRVVTQVLGEKNFNHMLNRHRIELACRMLAEHKSARSILDVSSECGFASLGPFNRAFKAATGCTPSTYRSMHQVEPGTPSSPCLGTPVSEF